MHDQYLMSCRKPIVDQPQPSPTIGFYKPGQYRPEQGLGYLMRVVLSSLRAQSNARMAEHGLTDVQWMPLYKLVLKPDHTVATLSRDLELDPAAMTRSLDRLEAKGLVRRERSTHDRRVVHLIVTEEGERLAQLAQAVVVDVLNQHLQGFSHAEFETLVQLLGRMLTNAQAMQSPLAD